MTQGKPYSRWLVIVLMLILAGVSGVQIILPMLNGRHDDVPFRAQLEEVFSMSKKLAAYAQAHSSSEEPSGVYDSVASLVAAGILSLEDERFIREHHIQYYGYDPMHFDTGTPVFELIYTNGAYVRRVIGFRDGHAEVARPDDHREVPNHDSAGNH